MSFDNVEKPRHYNIMGEQDSNGRSVFETIKVIESWGLGEGFCLGSALKYILRSKHKGSERQDLEKALWYLERMAEYGGLQAMVPIVGEFLPPPSVAEAWELSEHLTEAVKAISLGDPMAAASHVAGELAVIRMAVDIAKVEDERLLAEVERVVKDKYEGQADHEAAGWEPEK